MSKYVVSMIKNEALVKGGIYRVIKEFSGQVTIVNDMGEEQDIIVDNINFKYLNIMYSLLSRWYYDRN